MSRIYLSISGQNLTLKPVAGPNEKDTKKKILNMKVSPKIPIYKKGEFSHYEIPKDSVDLVFSVFPKEEVLIDKKAQSYIDYYQFSKIPLKDLPKEPLTILPKGGITLEPHQLEFVTYCYNKQHIAIFDDTGSGKTISMLMRAVNMGFEKMLVVTTKNNFRDWRRDSRRVLDIDPIEFTGTDKQLEKIDLESNKIILTNYEKVKKIKDRAKFDFIIMDEGHNSGDPETSKIFKDMVALIKANKDARRIVSTATPFDGDNLLSLWGVIYLVDPFIAGDKNEFIAKYQEPIKWTTIKWTRYGKEFEKKKAIKFKTKNTIELQRWLSTIAHRSDIKAEVKWKPVDDIIPLEMTEQQWDAYEEILYEIGKELDDGTFYKDNPLAKCARLFRVTEGLFFDDGRYYSTKHDWCVEKLNHYRKTGDRCVLWSAFVDPTEFLWGKFKDCAVIYNGNRSTTYKELAKIAFVGARDAVEEKFFYENCDKVKDFPFREPKSAQFFIGVGARRSGEGMNLASSDRQIIMSVNLSGRVTKQMIGRIKRLDSIYDTLYTTFIPVKNTVDEGYTALVLNKMAKVADILDGKDSEISVKAREIVALMNFKKKRRSFDIE